MYPCIHILLVPIHVSVTVLLIQSRGGTFYSLSAHFFIQSEGDHDPLNTGRVGALGTPLYSQFNFRSSAARVGLVGHGRHWIPAGVGGAGSWRPQAAGGPAGTADIGPQWARRAGGGGEGTSAANSVGAVRCCGVAKLPSRTMKGNKRIENQNSDECKRRRPKLFLSSEFLKSRSPLQVPVGLLL
jgi:hypothetical protein